MSTRCLLEAAGAPRAHHPAFMNSLSYNSVPEGLDELPTVVLHHYSLGVGGGSTLVHLPWNCSLLSLCLREVGSKRRQELCMCV